MTFFYPLDIEFYISVQHLNNVLHKMMNLHLAMIQTLLNAKLVMVEVSMDCVGVKISNWLLIGDKFNLVDDNWCCWSIFGV